MHANDLPIYELFTRLQEAGLPLGVSEYAQAIKAIQAGFGLPDQAALSRLCRALWVKTKEEEYTFNHHFTEIVGADSLAYADVANTNTQKSALYRDIVTTQQITAQTTRHIIIGTFFGALILLAMLFGVGMLSRTQDEDFSPGEITPPQTEDTVPPTTNPEFLAIPPSPEQEVSQVSMVLLTSVAGLMVLSTGISWLLIRRLKIIQNTSSEHDSDDFTNQVVVPITKVSDISNKVYLEEIINKEKAQKNKLYNINILGQDEYFPLTRRQMKQGWRHLRKKYREGPKTELDVDATVQQVASRGAFLGPLMRSPRSNQTDVVFLLDQDGSMVPFQLLSQRLVETATKSGHLANTSVYYFHNCPINHLYHDPLRQEPEAIDNFLIRRLSPKSTVVIVSDAGAARSGFNSNRVHKTKEFLKRLNQYSRYVVWLNPLPQKRWNHTTANEIASFVAMFEVNRAGFQQALKVLQRGWRISSTNLKRWNYDKYTQLF